MFELLAYNYQELGISLLHRQILPGFVSPAYFSWVPVGDGVKLRRETGPREYGLGEQTTPVLL